MEFKTIAGIKLPVLGIGTWGMGGSTVASTANDKKEIAAIKYAIELGMTHIDTAEYYGNGHAEELVGKAIADFGRSEIFITTKVRGSNLKHDQVINACKSSLQRLGTDYIDLYLVHWPNERVPIAETMKAMNSLVSENLVRHIGVSNFSVPELKSAQKCTENKLIANQIEYNLLARNKGLFTVNMEKEILPFCQKNDVIFTAYSPLGQGKILKYKPGILDEICKKYGKSRVQIALNWLVSKKNVVTIPKASSSAHLEEIAGSLGWSLEKKDIKLLDMM